LIGRHFDERMVLRIAHQYQSNVYPCPSPSEVSARPGRTETTAKRYQKQ
jgi:hypothetical protein